MSHPHIAQVDRDAIEDRGLVDNDLTPDMRKAPAATEALLKNTHHHITSREEVQP